MRKPLSEGLEAARVTSGHWGSTRDYGANGLFIIARERGPKTELRIIASDGAAAVAEGLEPWEHVSVSTATRCPTWDEMCRIKDLFWSEDETVLQFHPPKSEYVNNHAFCLHLWKPCGLVVPLPPSILVGVKALGTLKEAAA